MNIINVLWCRFEQCFSAFTILLVEVFSETKFFRHSSDFVFGVRNFRNKRALRVIFFSNYSKFKVNFKNEAKSWEKVFCFLHNCIWIGIVKFSLLRTRCLSSADNVGTCSPKIWRVNKTDFFQLNWLGTDQWIWYRCCEADFHSPWERLPCCLSKGPLKVDFLDIYLTMFSEYVVSEVQNLWASSFFSKYSKFNVDFRKAKKNLQQVPCFQDICIWIGIVKLPLLRTGYFSLTANVLRSSPKIWCVNKTDLFRLTCLGSDQWIS